MAAALAAGSGIGAVTRCAAARDRPACVRRHSLSATTRAPDRGGRSRLSAQGAGEGIKGATGVRARVSKSARKRPERVPYRPLFPRPFHPIPARPGRDPGPMRRLPRRGPRSGPGRVFREGRWYHTDRFFLDRSIRAQRAPDVTRGLRRPCLEEVPDQVRDGWVVTAVGVAVDRSAEIGGQRPGDDAAQTCPRRPLSCGRLTVAGRHAPRRRARARECQDALGVRARVSKST